MDHSLLVTSKPGKQGQHGPVSHVGSLLTSESGNVVTKTPNASARQQDLDIPVGPVGEDLLQGLQGARESRVALAEALVRPVADIVLQRLAHAHAIGLLTLLLHGGNVLVQLLAPNVVVRETGLDYAVTHLLVDLEEAGDRVELPLVVHDALEQRLLLLRHVLVVLPPLVEIRGLVPAVADVGVQGVENPVAQVAAVPFTVARTAEALQEGVALGFLTRVGLAHLLDRHDDLVDLDVGVDGDLGGNVSLKAHSNGLGYELTSLTAARSSAEASFLGSAASVARLVALKSAATSGSVEEKRMAGGRVGEGTQGTA